MRRLLASYRLTPAGGGLALVLTAAIVVLLAGPKQDETPAFVVIAVIAAMLVLQRTNGFGRGHGLGRRIVRGIDERRTEFRPRHSRLDDGQPLDESEQGDVRGNERETRQHDY